MRFRIYRMKPAVREAFRWSAHTGGQAVAKEKDYEPGGEIEAASEYAAWKQLKDRQEPLHPGDILESASADRGSGVLKIAKYIGFESAIWWTPALKPPSDDQIQSPLVPETSDILSSV